MGVVSGPFFSWCFKLQIFVNKVRMEISIHKQYETDYQSGILRNKECRKLPRRGRGISTDFFVSI